MKKILFAGESWIVHMTHIKGFDHFSSSKYEEGIQWIRTAIEKGGYALDYYPGHLVADTFPTTLDELKAYDVVVISDIGANSFLLANRTFEKSEKTPNRLQLLHDYVAEGGALLMIGGYLSFQGIDAKARYGGTPIEDCLPVTMLCHDDRVECPQGIVPQSSQENHPILQGIPAPWPNVLGYNRIVPKDFGDVLATVGEDPFLVIGSYGKGRSAAFATDCSPHWAPPEFVNWPYYDVFWKQLFHWLSKEL